MVIDNDLYDYLMIRAAQIHQIVRLSGTREVRWHDGRLLTYRYPSPRGYGVHGEFVAVYSNTVPLAWIKEDMLAFAEALSDTETVSNG